VTTGLGKVENSWVKYMNIVTVKVSREFKLLKQVERSCENRNKPALSIKGGKFIEDCPMES
jgi:hypothetical protein